MRRRTIEELAKSLERLDVADNVIRALSNYMSVDELEDFVEYLWEQRGGGGF